MRCRWSLHTIQVRNVWLVDSGFCGDKRPRSQINAEHFSSLLLRLLSIRQWCVLSARHHWICSLYQYPWMSEALVLIHGFKAFSIWEAKKMGISLNVFLIQEKSSPAMGNCSAFGSQSLLHLVKTFLLLGLFSLSGFHLDCLQNNVRCLSCFAKVVNI